MNGYADRSRNRYGLPFLAALLLHAGLIALAWVSWVSAPPTRMTASVPVELVAQVPSHEQMETPVDKLAVKTPTPEPAPEEPVKPEPVPTPAPKLPVPTQKEVIKPEPVKTPAKPVPAPTKPAVKDTPAPPDKNGMKKPQPDAKAKPDKAAPPAKPVLNLEDLANQMAAQAAKSHTRTPAQANTHATNGNSNSGAAPADAGQTANAARTELGRRLKELWTPNCEVPGGNQVFLQIRVWPSHGGKIVRAPQWLSPRNDPVWEAAFSRARAAVAQVDISDLTFAEDDYNKGIPVNFDARSACAGR